MSSSSLSTMMKALLLLTISLTGLLALPLDEDVEDLINYDVDPMLSVSDAELRSVSSQMWNQDAGSRFPSSDCRYNINGPRFFTYVNEGRFGGNSFNRFIPLLDNFNPYYGQAEPPCGSCRNEEDMWLNVVMSSSPLRTAWDFLIQKGLASSNFQSFKNLLKQLWFQFYARKRGGPIDSSGFEHTFVGEIDGREVKGFHNWVQWYQEEKFNAVSYRDKKKDPCTANLVSLEYFWLGGARKPYGSMFVGTSPEFEVALYTLCFLTRNGNCRTRLGGRDVTITTYSMNNVSPRTISTAYPSC